MFFSSLLNFSCIKQIFLITLNLWILSNNVNRFCSSKKRVKMFEYFKGQIVNSGVIFLQETHSSEDTFNEWRDDFKGEVFFCTTQQVLAVAWTFVLLSLYNSNSETEQLQTPSNVDLFLSKFYLDDTKTCFYWWF